MLNIIFGWELVNANKLTKNQKAYDLTDAARKVYVQVTADQNHRTKYLKTIAAFETVPKPADSQLIVLFITNKKPLKAEKENMVLEIYYSKTFRIIKVMM